VGTINNRIHLADVLGSILARTDTGKAIHRAYYQRARLLRRVTPLPTFQQRPQVSHPPQCLAKAHPPHRPLSRAMAISNTPER
jgi:hypothetical protein